RSHAVGFLPGRMHVLGREDIAMPTTILAAALSRRDRPAFRHATGPGGDIAGEGQDCAGAGVAVGAASGLIFSIVCLSSRPRITLASRAQVSRRWSKASLLLWSSFTRP